MNIYYVEEVKWDKDHNKGAPVCLLVEASSASKAADLAGEQDGVIEIGFVRNLGPVVRREEVKK